MQISDNEREYLRKIGLSFDAIDVYEVLLVQKQLTANQIAEELGLFTSAVYRLCYELEDARLIRVVNGRPKQFVTIKKKLGLSASFEQEKKILHQLINSDEPGSQTEMIIGRSAIYDAYMRHAEKAARSIHIYSIGIAYSKDLERAQAAVRKRGVVVRHVIQQKKLSNQHVIAHWQRLGIKLRYLPKERGFHFYLIDQSLVCITFSDPSDTESRLSIVTDNRAAIDLFSRQFQELWVASTTLDDTSA